MEHAPACTVPVPLPQGQASKWQLPCPEHFCEVLDDALQDLHGVGVNILHLRAVAHEHKPTRRRRWNCLELCGRRRLPEELSLGLLGLLRQSACNLPVRPVHPSFPDGDPAEIHARVSVHLVPHTAGEDHARFVRVQLVLDVPHGYPHKPVQLALGASRGGASIVQTSRCQHYSL